MQNTVKTKLAKRGIAVIMVVLTLSALVATATPFAISMFVFEKSAHSFSNSVRARLAAEGAAAHAMRILARTPKSIERKKVYGPPWNTPNYDTFDELYVSMELPTAIRRKLKLPDGGLTDAKNVIWSARIEDEQGKLNILTANKNELGALIGCTRSKSPFKAGARSLEVNDTTPFLNTRTVKGMIMGGLYFDGMLLTYTGIRDDKIIGLVHAGGDKPHYVPKDTIVLPAEVYQLEHAIAKGAINSLSDIASVLSPDKLEKFIPYITLHSSYEPGQYTSYSTNVRGRVRLFDESLELASTSNFKRGHLIGFYYYNPFKIIIPYVARIKRVNGTTVHLEESMPFKWSVPPTLFVSRALSQKININTAEPLIIYTMFEAVEQKNITGPSARKLAKLVRAYADGKEIFKGVKGRPLKSIDNFKKMLNKIKRNDNTFKKYNMDELGNKLRGRIIFESLGNYTIESSGQVYSKAGALLASHVIRQVVHVIPELALKLRRDAAIKKDHLSWPEDAIQVIRVEVLE